MFVFDDNVYQSVKNDLRLTALYVIEKAKIIYEERKRNRLVLIQKSERKNVS